MHGPPQRQAGLSELTCVGATRLQLVQHPSRGQQLALYRPHTGWSRTLACPCAAAKASSCARDCARLSALPVATMATRCIPSRGPSLGRSCSAVATVSRGCTCSRHRPIHRDVAARVSAFSAGDFEIERLLGSVGFLSVSSYRPTSQVIIGCNHRSHARVMSRTIATSRGLFARAGSGWPGPGPRLARSAADGGAED